MNTLDFVDQTSLRDDIPAFGPGDTINVHVTVIQRSKERIQVFKGGVRRRKSFATRMKASARWTFMGALLKMSERRTWTRPERRRIVWLRPAYG